MTEEELKAQEEAALKKIEEAQKKVAKEAAEDAVKGMKEDLEKANKTIKEQGETIVTQQKHLDDMDIELQKSSGQKKVETLESVISAKSDEIKGAIEKGVKFDFEIKADTLRASVVGNPDANDLTDVGRIAHRKLTLYDLFPKVPIGKGNNGVVRYSDWDAATSVRAAAMVAEGATFPQSTAKWITKTLNIKKVGDTVPASEELFYDAPRFAAELDLFLRTNVAMVVDTDLYGGDGTGENIQGIKTYAPAFVPVASGIVDASIYDLIVKVSESITKTGGSKFSPDFVLMNISTINLMRLKKDANNNYIIPPFVTRDGKDVDTMVVIECNAVPDNEMIVGDRRYGRIYEEPGVSVELGYATGDFESDMKTYKARRRLNLLIREVDKAGFRKVSSISAALTTLATT